MNTNETETYEIPEKWDVSIQEAYRRGWEEGLKEALASFNLVAPGKDVSVDMIRDAIAERLKEEG